jgi:predicted RND superfamily exporter protein
MSLGVAVISGVGVAVGTALVLVLVYRSLAEWRQSQERARGSTRPD